MGLLCPFSDAKLGKNVNNSSEKTKRGRRPSIDLEELRRLHSLGKTDTEIAEILNSKRSTISMARKRLGLPPNKKVKNQTKEIERLNKEGLSDGRIAEVLECDRSSIRKIRAYLELPANKKVEDEEVRFYAQKGWSDGQIAKEIDCTRQAVTTARNRLHIKANYLVGEHGAVTSHIDAAKDPDIAWMEEQQRLHAIEMSNQSKISSFDLLRWAGNGYVVGGRNNTTYRFYDDEQRPADIPKTIRTNIQTEIASCSSGTRKGKGGGQQSEINSIKHSAKSRT